MMKFVRSDTAERLLSDDELYCEVHKLMSDD